MDCNEALEIIGIRKGKCGFVSFRFDRKNPLELSLALASICILPFHLFTPQRTSPIVDA